MRSALAVSAILMLLLAMGVFALPFQPTGLRAGFDRSKGILLQWQYPGQENVSFKVFRGKTLADAEEIAIVRETSYLDRSFEDNQGYAYYIVAFDASGESISEEWVLVDAGELIAPFSISLVEPSGNAFKAGETVPFVVELETADFGLLKNVSVSLENEQLGLSAPFNFDAQKNIFYLTDVKMPETGQFEGLSTTYRIRAIATVEGRDFVQTKPVSLLVSPVQFVDTGIDIGKLFSLFAPVIVLLMAASTVAFVVWKWSLSKKVQKDSMRLELYEVHKERALWRHEAFKRQITPEQFREKEGNLQSKQAVLEEKLGLKRPKEPLRPGNIFEGFAPQEIEEIVRLVHSIGKPGKAETPDSLRARLVGLGRSEKVAKKVSELVFRK